MKLRTLTASLALAAGLGIAPASQALDLGNLAGGMVILAKAATLTEADVRANRADRLAAFGGCIALNREVDLETARLVAENYAEVVVAPEFAPGVMDLFAAKKKNR